MTEYALLLALVAVAAIGAITLVGTELSRIFTAVATQLGGGA